MLVHLLIVGAGDVVCQKCSETIISDNAEDSEGSVCILPRSIYFLCTCVAPLRFLMNSIYLKKKYITEELKFLKQIDYIIYLGCDNLEIWLPKKLILKN